MQDIKLSPMGLVLLWWMVGLCIMGISIAQLISDLLITSYHLQVPHLIMEQ